MATVELPSGSSEVPSSCVTIARAPSSRKTMSRTKSGERSRRLSEQQQMEEGSSCSSSSCEDPKKALATPKSASWVALMTTTIASTTLPASEHLQQQQQETTAPPSSGSAAARMRMRRTLSTSSAGQAASPLSFCSPLGRRGGAGGCWQGGSGVVTLGMAICAWYGFGFLGLVTAEELFYRWHVSPLLLTFQQLVLSSLVLRLYISSTMPSTKSNREQQPDNKEADGDFLLDHPWPWESSESKTTIRNFVLVGLLTAMEFVASNWALANAPPPFVDTIKSSEPLTTSAVALLFGVDRVSTPEAGTLGLLIVGILLEATTTSSAEDGTTTPPDESSPEEAAMHSHMSLHESVVVTAIVLAANLSVAFKAMALKLYRQHAVNPVKSEVMELCRFLQIGSVALLPFCVVLYAQLIWDAFFASSIQVLLQYSRVALTSALAFVVFNLGSMYVLNKLTVTHYAALSCLRRMFAIVATSVFFRIPVTTQGALGIFTCFAGFSGFTYYRSLRRQREE